MGNNDNSPIARQVAGYIVAPMWHAYMNELLSTLPNEPFKQPAADPDKASLKPMLRGVWQSDTGVHSILHYVDKDNPRGPAPANPGSDPQYAYWEYAVQAWALGQGITPGGTPVPGTPITDGAPSALSVAVVTPNEGSVVHTGDRVAATLRVNSNYPLVRADYFLNNIFIGSTTNYPFNFLFTMDASMGITGQNILKVSVTDQSGTSASAISTFTKQ
jgi:hypothetical protein